jgi:PAS domain S-box-containing protein
VPREQQDIMRNSLRKVFKTGNPDSYEISSNIPKIGTVWFATKVVPIKHDGRIDNVIMISTDTTKQKNVEEEIKTEKTRLESYIEGMSDGVVILTLKGGVINVNKAYSRMFGREKSEVIGKSVFSVGDLPKKEFLGAISMLKGILQKGSVENRELTLLNKEKKEVPILFSATLIKDRRGKLESIFTTFKDITERKQAEEKIKVFSDAVNSASDYFLLTDMKGNITYANESAIRAFGYTPEEFLGLNTAKLDTDPETGKKIIQNLMMKGKWNGEVMNIRKNKEKFPSFLSAFIIKDEKGNPKGMMGIIRDITERKKAEEEVATAWKYAENLIANMPSSVLVFDDKLKCTSANWTYHQTFKKNIKHIESEDITHTLPSGMITKYNLDKKVVEVMKTGKTIELTKCQYNSEIYNVKIVKIAKKAEEEEEEEEERFVMVIIDDVTEKVKAEEEIKKARDELVDKVAELERFSKVAVGRELKMVELKKRIVELERHLGKG